MLLFWLTSKFFKTWFRLLEKVLTLLSILEISQFTGLLSVDSCASIFQIGCLFTVSVGMFWVDCIDGVVYFFQLVKQADLKFQRNYIESFILLYYSVSTETVVINSTESRGFFSINLLLYGHILLKQSLLASWKVKKKSVKT